MSLVLIASLSAYENVKEEYTNVPAMHLHTKLWYEETTPVINRNYQSTEYEQPFL